MQKELEKYFDRLWPICRSLTGNGNRETLKILSEVIDLHIEEVPCGTQCFDWTIPPEWNVRAAWIKNSKGETVVDFKNNNLHLLGYSIPFKGTVSLKELREHLYSITEMPKAIPYLTSYYKERWGFCMAHEQLSGLKEDSYQVLIDSDLNPKGALTYGDAFIKGKSDKEILLSTYICHPSMANNELSGPLVTAFVYRQLLSLSKAGQLKYSYRFVFVPETIGSICYLSRHGQAMKDKLIAGFVVTTAGDAGVYHYKRSRRGKALPDRAAELLLAQS